MAVSRGSAGLAVIPALRHLKLRLRTTVLGRLGSGGHVSPEITNDEFSRVIERLASDPAVTTVLEIGSSNGAGSTRALVGGLRHKEDARLYCLELVEPRFAELVKRYEHLPWVHCYNLTSVLEDGFPSAQEVADFYHRQGSELRKYPLKVVQGWLRRDLESARRVNQPEGGIRMVMKAAEVTNFDLVLIDGSEFTGSAELSEVYGARYILLDDTRTFKNHASYARLSTDPAYRLVAEDQTCRNGFAAFELVGPR